MNDIILKDLADQGYSIINTIFSDNETEELARLIESSDKASDSFRKTADLFAIRSFLQTIPGASDIIWKKEMKDIVFRLFGPDYFVVKSIFFDKPALSNWFVPWHQDLTISVDKKVESMGFSGWTTKQGQVAVQPPLNILENIFTIRIHLDDCDETNGALKVIPGSHKTGVIRPETLKKEEWQEVTCNVRRGGVMIMKPLLMHASARSVSNKQRRVVHMELADTVLPNSLEWRERQDIGLKVKG